MLPAHLSDAQRMLLTLGVLGLLVLGILLWKMPLVGLGLGLAVPLLIVLLAWPELATPIVIFLLYINAPVVVVTFHGVPYLVGASVILLLGFPLAYYILARRESVIIDRATPWFLAFLAIQFICLVFSRDPVMSMNVMIASVVEGFAVYVLIVNVIRTPRVLRLVTWMLLLAGSFLGGLSAFQYATKTYHNNYGGFSQAPSPRPGRVVAPGTPRRISGPIGESNRYAQVMLMLVPLAFFRFLGERSRLLRLLALAAMVLAMFGPLLAFSRGAGVGFFMMVGIMVALRYIRLSHAVLIVVAGLLILLAVPQYAERFSGLSDVWRMVNEEDQEGEEVDSSIEGRYSENMSAALMYAENPLIGVGPGMYPLHYREYAERLGGRIHKTLREPHTLYLGIAAELGTPGIAVFLVMVYLVLRDLVRGRRRCLNAHPDLAHMATAFMLAVVAYLTTGLFLHFSYVRYYWMMLAMASAAARIACTVPLPAAEPAGGETS
jgi:hypothetical protein